MVFLSGLCKVSMRGFGRVQRFGFSISMLFFIEFQEGLEVQKAGVSIQISPKTQALSCRRPHMLG